MNRDTVILQWPERVLICREIFASLARRDVEVIQLCVSATHFHVLCRFTPLPASTVTANPDPPPDRSSRHLIGIAKKDSARALSESGLRPEGGLWAVRSKCKPIRNRSHQIRVARYILAHYTHDAAVWRLIREGRQR